jgi:hypothetical protein
MSPRAQSRTLLAVVATIAVGLAVAMVRARCGPEREAALFTAAREAPSPEARGAALQALWARGLLDALTLEELRTRLLDGAPPDVEAFLRATHPATLAPRVGARTARGGC